MLCEYSLLVNEKYKIKIANFAMIKIKHKPTILVFCRKLTKIIIKTKMLTSSKRKGVVKVKIPSNTHTTTNNQFNNHCDVKSLEIMLLAEKSKVTRLIK